MAEIDAQEDLQWEAIGLQPAQGNERDGGENEGIAQILVGQFDNKPEQTIHGCPCHSGSGEAEELPGGRAENTGRLVVQQVDGGFGF